MGSISEFIERNFRHFNAAVLKDAADAYIAHLDRGGKMMITLAGAMSTAELGVSLAEMIRRDKVHAITCTGANMEEDLFNLVARSKYERIPNYRELSPQQEQELLRRHLNRVTDTCIPEEEAMRRIERVVLDEWVGRLGETTRESFPTSFFTKFCASAASNNFTRSIQPIVGWSPLRTRTFRCSCPAGKIRPSETFTPRAASPERLAMCRRSARESNT